MTPFWDSLFGRSSEPRESFDDPALGHLHYDASENGWRVTTPSSFAFMVLAQRSEVRPHPQSVRAVQLHLSQLDSLPQRIKQLLDHEALLHPELTGELATLDVCEIMVGLEGRPDVGMIWFDGGDEETVWRCAIEADGTLRHLGFDH